MQAGADEGKDRAPWSVLLGDCLDRLRGMESGVVDLAYLDPPFFTGRMHRLSARDRCTAYEFGDIWESAEAYEAFMHERLIEIRRVLSPAGSIFFHCGRDAGHIVRGLLDRVFGPEMFRSEIIWRYRRWSRGASSLLPAHQTIHYYTKSNAFVFNPIWEEYSPATNVDQLLQRRRRDSSGKSVYARNDDGGTVPANAKRGVPLSDVWDIPFLNPKARERTGYPTQKPLILLERIVALASRPEGVVLDPFCGSGTTLVAAVSMGRRAIGIDRSPEAVTLSLARLQSPVRSRSRLLERGRESYRTVDPDSLTLLAGLDATPVHRNRGIDAIAGGSDGVGLVAIRVQRLDETVAEAAARLRRAGLARRAARMFLVVRRLEEEDGAAEGVELIDSPDVAIARRIRDGA